MVYLAKKAGRVPAHTDLQAMYELDGVDFAPFGRHD
jgi:hypothetical protein